MSKIAVVLFFLIIAVPAMSQTISRGSLTDSTINAKEDSLAIVEMFSHHHRAKPFLENTIAIGGTIGTPGGLNGVFEGYYNRFGLRLEAGAIPLFPLITVSGAQADLCFVLVRDEEALFEFTLFYSMSYSKSFDDDIGNSSSRLGGGIVCNAGGFFFEAGFTPNFLNALRDRVPTPVIIQIGYVH